MVDTNNDFVLKSDEQKKLTGQTKKGESKFFLILKSWVNLFSMHASTY